MQIVFACHVVISHSTKHYLKEVAYFLEIHYTQLQALHEVMLVPLPLTSLHGPHIGITHGMK
jgi:hypothetical protein